VETILFGGVSLMPRIRVILENDNGSPLPESVEQVYVLENECDTLNQIDEAVEQFKNVALPHIEQTLLAQSQQRFVTQEKKTVLET
jgi:hypothetical protein